MRSGVARPDWKKLLCRASVAEQVFRHAACPVLTVGPHTVAPEAAKIKIATVLFATDFSHGSQRALTYAESLARANRAHLVVLHAVGAMADSEAFAFPVEQPLVYISAESIDDAIARARAQLVALFSPATTQELNPEVIVECGGPAQTILSVAMNKQADLIVMGAHRASHSSLASHLPWEPASDVVRQAHCPVLTVRS